MPAAVVPVNSVVSVHFVEIELRLLDDIVVAYHDAGDWAHEAGIAREECEKACSILYDVPWCRDDAEERDENGATEDVDVLRSETSDIV